MSQTRLAAKALIQKDGKYLLMTCQFSDGSLYQDLPGGKVEFGEAPEQALTREAREELNAKVTIDRLLGYYQFFTKDGGTHTTCLTFLCSLENSEQDFQTENNADLSEKVLHFAFLSKEELVAQMNNDSFGALIANSL